MTHEGQKLRLGTSSWSCADWVGRFYEPGTLPKNFLASYARKFGAVEIDSTFYGVPRRSTVEHWRDQTPEDFVFAAKTPGTITHEKFLMDCTADLRAFLDALSVLGSRLGPLLLQFPYYSRSSGVTEDALLTRLNAFLPALPKEYQWAVEVRNKTWIKKPLLDLLGEFKAPLALIDHPWMAPPGDLFAKKGILTGDFAYIRWLGDRYAIEKRVTAWNETIIDRRADLECWVPHIKRLLDNRFSIFGFVNNHYSGYAPEGVELITQLLRHAGWRDIEPIPRALPTNRET